MSNKITLDAPSQANVVVVGGGTMGSDVAVVFLRASSQVFVVESNTSLHETIRQKIQQNLENIGKAENIEKLVIVADIHEIDWSSINLMVECIPEKLSIKQDLFKTLASLAPAHVLLSSNSSSFPISQIAEGLETQERMIGLHFFMPAHIVPLAEVILGENTEPELGEILCKFMRRCGSVPILVRKDIAGFIGNRLQHALGREAYALIQAGIVTHEDIDNAVRFGFGFRYIAAGPILQKDHAGLEVHVAAATTIYPSLANDTSPLPILTDKPKNGTIGMKTGEGFYQWTPETIKAERERYDEALRKGLEILASDLPPIRP